MYVLLMVSIDIFYSYRHSQDLDDLDAMTSSSKSQQSSQGENCLFKLNKSLDTEKLSDDLLIT